LQFIFAGALACALPLAAAPAAATEQTKSRVRPKEAEHASKEPFGHIPKGPLQIIISIDQQKLHLYSDGTHVTDTLVATGVTAHPTPLGAFSIIQKSRYHRSNIYSGAPMPYMQRITWSGIAIHEGVGVGHRASHGCVRVPHEFATRLWALTRLGARVIIARSELRPEAFADPHLFVHGDPPAAPAPTAPPPMATLLKTAQTGENATTIDAAADRNKDAADPAQVRDAVEPPAAEAVPVLPAKPAVIPHAGKMPISIFISRKDKKIYVRQDFAPLFDAPIAIEQPEQHVGTHIFTALDYLADHAHFRWNVVSPPDQQVKAQRQPANDGRFGKAQRRNERGTAIAESSAPVQTPQQALARIEIPQDAIDQISQLIVPGSSLIVSDHGLGDETGEGTDFIIVTR
jgi:hypothetical protein